MKVAIPQVKLPKAPPKARALAIVVMTLLVLGSIYSVLSDFPLNGNPIAWLKAKELYLDGMEMRKRFLLPGALEKFEKAVGKYPRDAHFQYSLGEALERQERYKEAEDHFQQAVKLNPGFVDAWLHLASVQYQLQKPEESEKSTREALKIDPEAAEAQCQLATILAAAGKKDQADKMFTASQKAAHPSARFYFLEARYDQSQGKNKEALQAYRRAARMDHGSPEFAESYGMFLISAGKPGEAVQWLRAACDLNPNNADCWEALGIGLFSVGAKYEATIALHEAVKRDPENAVYVKRFGSALAEEKKWPLAEDEFHKLIDRGSDDMSVWNMYFKSAEQTSSFGAMRKKLLEIAEHGNNRTKALAYTFLGDLHRMQGTEKASYDAYRQALAYDTNDQLKKYLQDRLEEEKQDKQKEYSYLKSTPAEVLKKLDPKTRKAVEEVLKSQLPRDK